MSDALTIEARALQAQAIHLLDAASSIAELSVHKATYLGKGGSITALLARIPSLDPADRRLGGAAINDAKRAVEDAFGKRLEALRDAALGADLAPIDPTLPGRPAFRGHLHPVTLVMAEICDIFSSMGYAIEEGPEVEWDFHNFQALNMPPGHPAREMQDTFYVEGGVVLRTHTSPVQVRTMLAQDPPIRMICPGTVYRKDHDATHSPMFHQVEGLVVDDRCTMADLKGTLAEFAQAFFGPKTKVRFRASFFPFTEPSAELDVTCAFCSGGPCRICKGTGWIEVGGAGMVDPAVFAEIGRPEYHPDRTSGFAFGMGLDRLAMLKFGIDDLRLLFEGDQRFLEVF